MKKAILDWQADPLEIKDLDLTGRQLKELPNFPWSKLENLKTIDLSGNNLDVIPVAFIHLPQLEKVVRKPTDKTKSSSSSSLSIHSK